MKLKRLEIKNFRNFESISIDLDNKNVIFGMNDIGKTNFLYAIRFLLDKDVRRNRFSQTDYHKNNVENDISITLELDISDFDESEDTKNLVSQAGDVRSSKNHESFYIRVIGEYNHKEAFGEPKLFWGDDIDNLIDMENNGYSFKVDNVFQVVYINPLIDLDKIFIKNKRILMNESKSSDSDKEILKQIESLTSKVNKKISGMEIIGDLQENITKEYLSLRKEDIQIEMKSEMAIKGVFSDIVPYIKKKDDDKYYPTSGDGRRKILAYSILNLLNNKLYEDKIIVYLIEEPENSLHRSMQISLSRQLFSEKEYNYCFISTHSSDILYELDNTNLIRIYSSDKIECKSHIYNVPKDFKKNKKKLNKHFCNALFSERVLLIEGPSEYVLFEKVMNEINYDYELEGGYILQVNGTYFKTYFDAFKDLNIKIIVKTDNDLKVSKSNSSEYELLGINRFIDLIEKDKKPNINIKFNKNEKESKKAKKNKLKTTKKRLFRENKDLIKEFEDKNIFLSEIDLENDLAKVIVEKMCLVLESDKDKVVDVLQSKKLYKMIDLVDGLDENDCKKIYRSKYFKCLKELNNAR
ncbi:ATP-dependent nuclease [Clostridium perfringens]|uniref:ATP-dependent nuclease n=1 Tax=Clostridium perfringens TaxID=1502 RepID=UPI001EE0A8DE|nr:AAA family ATPase [Clostridium perfringens]MCG4560293.1 AAA family ATPase [Clostridium perfringens]